MKYNWVFASLAWYMDRDLIEDLSVEDMKEETSFNAYLQSLSEADWTL